MHEKVFEKVSVIAYYNRDDGSNWPIKIRWNGRAYSIVKRGYLHRIKEGEVLCHIYSVTSETLAFKLRFNTKYLHWTLEEVHDGLAD